MPAYVLYGHPESGHSYKVALALTLLGQPFEYRRVEVFEARDARREDWRAASRWGEIPVLLVDGVPICQSDAILAHLARTTGELGGGDELDQSVQWLFWEANRVGISVPNLRVFTRGWAEADPGVIAWLRARAEADLSRLDQELADRSFLVGDQPTVADVACCGYLFFAEEAQLELASWPKVAEWLDRIRALPGWKHPYDMMA